MTRSQMGLSADSFQSIRFASPQRLFAADNLMELAASLGMAGAHGGMPDITFEWARRSFPEGWGYFIEHRDGFRTTLFMLPLQDFNYAGLDGESGVFGDERAALGVSGAVPSPCRCAAVALPLRGRRRPRRRSPKLTPACRASPA